MESKKIESIFEDYLNKEKTNYALLISGRWGSGKTYLWKNILEKKAAKMEFKPVYVSLNGISDVREIESILLSKVMPFADKLENEFIKNSLKFLRNGANAIGNILGGGTQLADLTRGIDLNLDLSKLVLCFDDLERCQLPLKEVLGLINDYTEHKNLKVIICADEAEIKKKVYNKVKEKVIGRVLKYNADYDEIFDSYVKAHSDSEFCNFLNKKKNIIIQFFKKHDIQNLRTFGFYLENISLLYKYYKDENEIAIENMLFFTAIISNEFKSGELTVSHLKDKKGIKNAILYVDLDEIVDGYMGSPIVKRKTKEKKVKSYKERFTEKYLNTQNDKSMFVFSDTIFEFVLSGYLDEEKLKGEISKRYGNKDSTEEDRVYNTLMGYNFRLLENDDLDTAISKVLEFAEGGKYNMYNYQSIYNNLKYHIEIGSLNLSEEELVSRLIKGLGISKNISDVNLTQMDHIQHFKKEEKLNAIESKIFEFHNQKRSDEKSTKMNKIFNIIEKELVVVDNFFVEVLNSENCLFEFIDPVAFFKKIIALKNKNLLVFSNALADRYKKSYFEFPEKELPFFETLKELIKDYMGDKDLKHPKKIILEELLVRIDEIIKRFSEATKLRT
ncbi:P-loop NTPase fold protein [Winogradskyella sp.]|uniref:P-loop NTPase fold protein n=1 Tax=Winogradskyella sp. TaxID=1883156 RepID=UPI003BAB17D7